MTTIYTHVSCQTIGPPYNVQKLPFIKSFFTYNMHHYGHIKQTRIQLNLAYQQQCNLIYLPPYSNQQQQLISNIYKGDLNSIKKQIQLNPNLLNFRTKTLDLNNQNSNDKSKRYLSNYPLIYKAVMSGHYDVVQYILSTGISLDFSKDRSTPMHCAAYYGFQYLIPLLCLYGIPTKIINFGGSGSLPQQETNNLFIKHLIKQSQQNEIYNLINKLVSMNKVSTVLNLKFDNKKSLTDVKKIILNDYFNDYKGYIDAFHGTSFDVLQSIVKNGLIPAGYKLNYKILNAHQHHIPLGIQVNNIENWANAIFASPSIFYATDSCYSQSIKVTNSIQWLPILQVKIKTNEFTKHKHTFYSYTLKDNQPNEVQYRVSNSNMSQPNTNINMINKNIRVVSILMIRVGLLQQYRYNYNELTNLILNSKFQQIYRQKNKDKFYNNSN